MPAREVVEIFAVAVCLSAVHGRCRGDERSDLVLAVKHGGLAGVVRLEDDIAAVERYPRRARHERLQIDIDAEVLLEGLDDGHAHLLILVDLGDQEDGIIGGTHLVAGREVGQSRGGIGDDIIEVLELLDLVLLDVVAHGDDAELAFARDIAVVLLGVVGQRIGVLHIDIVLDRPISSVGHGDGHLKQRVGVHRTDEVAALVVDETEVDYAVVGSDDVGGAGFLVGNGEGVAIGDRHAVHDIIDGAVREGQPPVAVGSGGVAVPEVAVRVVVAVAVRRIAGAVDAAADGVERGAAGDRRRRAQREIVVSGAGGGVVVRPCHHPVVVDERACDVARYYAGEIVVHDGARDGRFQPFGELGGVLDAVAGGERHGESQHHDEHEREYCCFAFHNILLARRVPRYCISTI